MLTHRHHSEDDDNKEGHRGRPICHSYQLPIDDTSPAGREMGIIATYLKDTRLEDVMSNLSHMLLSQPKLPYNPYPGLVCRLRHLAEGFHLLDMPSSSSKEFVNAVLQTSVAGMWGVKGCDNVWSLKHIASVIDGQSIKQYDWLVQHVTPRSIAGIDKQPGFTGQILVALVGPAAFTGSFYPEATYLDFKLEYVIYGSNVNVGLDLFVRSIMEDIDATNQEDCPHHILGVSLSGTQSLLPSSLSSSTRFALVGVSTSSTTLSSDPPSHATLSRTRSHNETVSGTGPSYTKLTSPVTSRHSGIDVTPVRSCVWTVEDIQGDRRKEFMSAMLEAIKKKQLISQQCVFLVNKEKDLYKQGRKQYVLHFIETNEDSNEESLYSFAKLPFMTLHEGIFYKKADCEIYMMTMSRHLHIDKEVKNAKSTQASNNRAQQMGLERQQRQDSGRQEDVANVQMAVSSIRLYLEQEISLLDPVLDIFKFIHLAINLILAERFLDFDTCHLVIRALVLTRLDYGNGSLMGLNKTDIIRQTPGPQPLRARAKVLTICASHAHKTKWNNDVLVELHHFCHSTAYKWYIAMCYNTTIQELLQYKLLQQDGSSEQQNALLKSLLLQYRDALLQVLDTALHNRSSDQHTVHRIVKTRLNRLCSYTKHEHADYHQLMTELISLHCYCTTVSLLLVDDAMSFFQYLDIQDLFKRCKKVTTDPKLVSINLKPTASSKKVPQKNSKTHLLKQNSADKPAIIVHGVEDKRFMHQGNKCVVLEDARRESAFPRIMVTEAVFIQYLVDVKLDEVWREFLLRLLCEPWLPPNPYPSLITHMRQAAFRMQLCQETDAQLSKQILRGQPKLVDKSNYVYNIPGSRAYGCAAALTGVDVISSNYHKISAIAMNVVNKLVISRKGQFQIFSGLAICDLCPMYGKLVPYLNELVLHEHYYIKGPMGAHKDAIQLFAKIVYKHVMEIYEQNMYVVMGVYFEESSLFPVEKIALNKEEFTSQLKSAVHEKQDLFIKLYQVAGWRYIGIVKYLRFHYLYVDKTEDRCEAFYPTSLIHYYQSVFLTQKQASFHFQQSRCDTQMNTQHTTAMKDVNDALDKQIRDAMRKDNDMIQVYKMLVTKTLINKNAVCIAELWRVLHSIAFQLYYVKALNQALQDLIYLALENPKQFTPLTNPASKKKSKPTKIFPLKENSLHDHFRAFTNKVQDIMCEPCAFAPKSVVQLLQTKMAAIASTTSPPVSGSTVNIRTIGILKDIADLLQPFEDIVARDVLAICPHTEEVYHHAIFQGDHDDA